jgi:hypothetical protein
MRKLLLFLILLFASNAVAQQPHSDPTNPMGGNLNVQDAGVCSTAGSYLWQKLPINAGTTTVNLAGTFVGTVTIRESNNGGGTWTTAGTQTAVGTSTYATGGFTDLCADLTTFTSGIFQVSISTGLLQVQSVVSGGSSGSGITQVASLPGSCTFGTSASPVNLTTYPLGLYFCQPIGIYAPENFSRNIIDASVAPYSVQPGIIAFDCTFTSGQPTVVCTTTVPNSTEVGWIYKATNGCCGTGGFTTGVHEFPAGTILSVNAGTKTFTLSQNALANVSPGSTIFGAGPNATTGLAAAWTAATSGPNCLTIQLPGGPVFTTTGQFNTATPCLFPISGSGDTQTSIFGWGAYTSLVVLSEGFSFTTGAGNSCPPISSINTCFGASQATRMQNWGITALGDSAIGGATNISLFTIANDSQMLQMGCFAVATNNSAITGVTIITGAQAIELAQLDGCGSLGMNVTDTSPAVLSDSFVGDNTNGNVLIQGGALLSNNNGFANPGTAKTSVSLTGAAYLASSDDAIENPSAANTLGLELANTSSAHLTNLLVNIGGTASSGALVQLNSSTVSSCGSTYVSSLSFGITASSTSKFLSCGANNITGIQNLAPTTASVITTSTDIVSGSFTSFLPTCAFTTGGGTTPSCAMTTGSMPGWGTIIASTGTGAPGTTGTLTLNFNQLFSVNGNAPACTISIDNSGTAWGNEAVSQVGTQSTTAPIFDWANVATAVLTALTTSSPYRMDYVCQPR